MTVEGVDLATIGLFSLVSLPYSFKFLWAPFMDRYVPPFLGRRRGWLVITQVALVLAIGAMSFHDPGRSIGVCVRCGGDFLFEVPHAVEVVGPRLLEEGLP